MTTNINYIKKIENTDYFDRKNIINYKKKYDLVHYSMLNSGNAFYFKKIILNSVFMMKPILFSKSKYFEKNTHGSFKLLSFGGHFQQKYCFITSSQQIRRGINTAIFSNDSRSIGTFKNIFYSGNQLYLNSILLNYCEAKSTTTYKTRNLFLLKNLIAGGHLLYSNLIQCAPSNLNFRTKSDVKAFSNFIIYSKNISYTKLKENLSSNLVSINYFIRTIWYINTLKSNNTSRMLNWYDNQGIYKFCISKSEYLKNYNAAELRSNTFSTLSIFENEKVDIIKNLNINRRGTYKKFVKNYPVWRLGIVHWGKKILNFKKNYLFWKYMRGLTNYFYRGYHINSVFNYRADVFVLRTFGVKSLKFSRILIMSGHIFLGKYSINNVKTRILRYNIVSISKKANNYLSKKKYFKYWNGDKNYFMGKMSNRVVKATPLKYCRQQKDLVFWGDVKNTKYSMFYGHNLGVLNADSKRTKFFSLNYFYIQKSVVSAWW